MEVDPYTDEDGEKQTRIVRHWVALDGEFYDFAKGTLSWCRSDEDVYDPEVENPENYHPIHKIGTHAPIFSL